MKMFSLKGKNAVVTGAGGFFGGYFVEALLRYRACVIATDKSQEDLMQLRKKMCNLNLPQKKNLVCLELNQYDHRAVRRVFHKAWEENGPVDILINNAFDFSNKTGFNDPNGKLERTTFKKFMSCLESGLGWAFQASQVIGCAMKKEGHGSIINISSMYAVVSPSPDLYSDTERFNPPGYGPAKAGLCQLTKYLASFLAPEVRVNTISPGAFPIVDPKSPNALLNNEDTEFRQRLINKTLLKRLGHPEDLLGTLLLLASDSSSYITGQNIIIDGGWTVN